MHYLQQSGKIDGLSKFLDALRRDISPEKAFQDAFQITYAQMEAELRTYVKNSRYQYNVITFAKKLVFDSSMTAERMSDAASSAYLGDLLYHTNRADDAEPYLQTALKLEPDLSMANATLGMVMMRQGKLTEARAFLEKAIADDRTSHIALYRYAFLLSREAQNEFGMVNRFDKESSTKMRDALTKAIALNPAFTESYELLAFINMVNKEAFDESLSLLETALKYQPGNQRYALRAAEILMRQNKIAEASEIANKIARTTDEPEIRRRAEELTRFMEQKREFEERAAARQKAYEAGGRQTINKGREIDKPVTEAELKKMQAEAAIRSINQALRKTGDDEVRVIGRIHKIECKNGSIVYSIKALAESFTVTSKDFDGLDLNTFEQAANSVQVGCDENISGFEAVITYLSVKTARSGSRGELRSLEFVPGNFRFMTVDEMANTTFVVYEMPDDISKASDLPPKTGPVVTNTDDEQRQIIIKRIRGALVEPADGEKREIGFLDKIECSNKAVYYHFRTVAGVIRLLNPTPQTLPIRLFIPDLEGTQFGCALKPVEFPVVFVYRNDPNAKAGIDGEVIAVDFVPKSFVLE